MLSIHKMVGPEGFLYLTRHVAVHDGAALARQSVSAYYAATGNPPGRWIGRGVAALGRTVLRLQPGDVVEERALEALFRDGRDPLTGGAVGGRLKVAGYDLTFTAPKSASVLWALGDEATRSAVAAAHEAAVGQALEFVETSVLRTRVGHGGARQLKTRGLIAAAFDHWDSRAGDPNLHTHVVVLNRVQGVDGVWRSIDGSTVHQAAVAVSELYDALLTDEAARRLPVSWSWRDRGESRNLALELDRLSDELLAAFSTRSQAIAAAQKSWAASFRSHSGRAPSRVETTRARERLTLATRPAKTAHSLRDLLSEWANRARALTGLEPVDLAAAALVGAYGRPLHAHDVGARVRSELVAAALVDASTPRSVWSTWNLAASVLRASQHLPMASAANRFALTDQLLTQAVEGCIRLDVPVPDRPVRRGEERYTSAELLAAERLQLDAATPSGTRVRRAPLDADLAAYVAQRGADQAAAVTVVAESLVGLNVMVGPAGSGKTTTLAALAAIWPRHRLGEVIALAPSATAAHVLGTAIGVRAETTAKWLHESVGPGAAARSYAQRTARVDEAPLAARARLAALGVEQDRWRLRRNDLLIVDEASLADTRTLAHLTGQAAAAGAKVLLVGDRLQRGAIDAGGAFAMLANRGPTAQLAPLRRFTQPWEAPAVLALRHGSATAIDDYARHKRIQFGTHDEVVERAADATATALSGGQTVIAQTVDTATATELNALVRARRQAAGLVGDISVTLADGLQAGVGDRVVTRHNDRHLRYGADRWVRNGSLWHVTATHPDGSLDVTDADGHSTRPPAAYVTEHVELGYATTSARSQGVTVDVIHNLVAPGCAREDLYVAMSRGRHANHLYLATTTPGTECLPGDTLPSPQEVLTQILATTRLELSATDTWDRHHPDRPLRVPLPAAPVAQVVAPPHHLRPEPPVLAH